MKSLSFSFICAVWFLLLASFLGSTLASSCVVQDRTIEHFTSLVKQGRYQEAADQCLAPEASFYSPRFRYKSRSEWLTKFPVFCRHAVACYIGPLQKLSSDRAFIRYAKIKLFGIILSVKEIIELNDEGKIVRSEIRFA